MYKRQLPLAALVVHGLHHAQGKGFGTGVGVALARHILHALIQAGIAQACLLYTSSAAAHGDTVRTITACGVERKGDEVEITVTADGYLYNMVRILAGTRCV